MIRKVYISTSGAYSDYSVEAAYLNEEDAKNCPKGDDYLELVLNDGPMDLRTRYHASWDTRFQATQKIHVITDDEEYDGNEEVTLSSYKNPVMNHVRFAASSWDREKAVKLVSDARAQYLAKKAGIA